MRRRESPTHDCRGLKRWPGDAVPGSFARRLRVIALALLSQKVAFDGV
jgi:hypothetical protein